MISKAGLVTLGALLCTGVSYMALVVYRHRSKINQLWITVHLLFLQKYVDQLPPNANVQMAMKGPIYPAFFVTSSPEISAQIAVTHNLPKTTQLESTLLPITGGRSLIAMNGDEWKTWRGLFNPGFSSASMLENVPHIVDCVQVFCEKLKEQSGRGILCLDELTTRLTTDVIIKVTLRLMDTYIRDELEKRFQKLKIPATDKSSQNKSVISLVLEAYIAAQATEGIASAPMHLDHRFVRYATSQIRLFLFAGNDTTSSSIVYTFHLLSKHPVALEKLRQEHNECRYTLAVIKETLRLYPPASTMREPRSGVVVTDRQNNSYPLDTLGANIVHTAVHTNPRVWPRSEAFIPEHFLVDADHELYPNPTAYRPFEQGPRSCIGQTLVYAEMKTVLVMTTRPFKITPAYEEWDALQLRNERWAKRLGRRLGVVSEHPKTVHGDRAYQTEVAGTHLADGYPCRAEVYRPVV
ncbi:cytochrome P450 [Lentithecium fluviatile CBS 122367]|uniref:Cytochrome P450 n=1 Tax=Lentithecium fluviatile CBS 122367 TaxID=1168545 RepID=A0A6G1IUG2_9PLEO|nr:cytochrome P450 [Lentithecium fluviatile CBS 122367]